MCQLLCSELKTLGWRLAEPLSIKSLLWESDVPIKQAIWQKMGIAFMDVWTRCKPVRAPKKEHSAHPREVRMGSLGGDSQLRCEGCSHEAARGRALCAEQEQWSKESFYSLTRNFQQSLCSVKLEQGWKFSCSFHTSYSENTLGHWFC